MIPTGRRRRRPRVIHVTGVFRQGQPLDRTSDEQIQLAADALGTNEEVYRVGDEGIASLNVRTGDLLIVQRRRGRVASGVLVLAELEGRAYLGRWRASRGRRAVFDENMEILAEHGKLKLLGAVTTIVRGP